MPTCCVFGCSNSSDKDRKKGITFHRFPQNSDLRKHWIIAVRRKNWQPSHASVVCSKHFREDQLDRYSAFKVRIKENEVPCIFPAFPSYVEEKTKHRRILLKQVTPVIIANSVPDEISLKDSLIGEKISNMDLTENTIYISNSQNIEHTALSPTSENSLIISERSSDTNLTEITIYTSNSQDVEHATLSPISENSLTGERSSDTNLTEIIVNNSNSHEVHHALPPISENSLTGERNSHMDLTGNIIHVLNSEEVDHTTLSAVSENSSFSKKSSNMDLTGNTVDISNSQEVHQITFCPMYENSLKCKLKNAENLIKNYRKKVRMLQQKIRRMKKYKILDFARLINDFSKAKNEKDILDVINIVKHKYLYENYH